jgi:hypothetical protein
MKKKANNVISDVSPTLIMQQIWEEYNGGPLPEDVERRRKANLQKFLDSHLEYLQSLGQETEPILEQADKKSPSTMCFSSKYVSKQGKSVTRYWDLNLDLKLLQVVKELERARKLNKIPGELWDVVAKSLPNPYNREKEVFTMSCRVEFQNIVRVYKEQRHG